MIGLVSNATSRGLSSGPHGADFAAWLWQTVNLSITRILYGLPFDQVFSHAHYLCSSSVTWSGAAFVMAAPIILKLEAIFAGIAANCLLQYYDYRA